jgi:hypothetical protein
MKEEERRGMAGVEKSRNKGEKGEETESAIEYVQGSKVQYSVEMLKT